MTKGYSCVVLLALFNLFFVSEYAGAKCTEILSAQITSEKERCENAVATRESHIKWGSIGGGCLVSTLFCGAGLQASPVAIPGILVGAIAGPAVCSVPYIIKRMPQPPISDWVSEDQKVLSLLQEARDKSGPSLSRFVDRYLAHVNQNSPGKVIPQARMVEIREAIALVLTEADDLNLYCEEHRDIFTLSQIQREFNKGDTFIRTSMKIPDVLESVQREATLTGAPEAQNMVRVSFDAGLEGEDLLQ